MDFTLSPSQLVATLCCLSVYRMHSESYQRKYGIGIAKLTLDQNPPNQIVDAEKNEWINKSVNKWMNE